MKKALVIVHGDFWGLENANALVKAAMKQGLQVQLVVSAKKMGEDGFFSSDKVAAMKESEVAKERDLLAMLDVVDAKGYAPGKAPELLSFKALDKLTRPDTTHDELFIPTWLEGEKAFDKIVANYKPDIILSGDTLAKLSKDTVEKVPCYSIHPGPLPIEPDVYALVPGLNGTERQVVRDKMYEVDGRKYVVGTLFKQDEGLDTGHVVAYSAVEYKGTDSLMAVRTHMFEALADTMVKALPDMINGSIQAHPQPAEKQKKVMDLKTEQVDEWLHADAHHKIYAAEDVTRIAARILPKDMKLESLLNANLSDKTQTKTWLQDAVEKAIPPEDKAEPGHRHRLSLRPNPSWVHSA